jgi:uncharacterized membrane protein
MNATAWQKGCLTARRTASPAALNSGAAIQVPIIMMSQNRQAYKDRMSAEHDYEVNLKAKLEIIALHDKIDSLREKQWAELLSIQHEQINLLKQLIEGLKKIKTPHWISVDQKQRHRIVMNS